MSDTEGREVARGGAGGAAAALGTSSRDARRWPPGTAARGSPMRLCRTERIPHGVIWQGAYLPPAKSPEEARARHTALARCVGVDGCTWIFADGRQIARVSVAVPAVLPRKPSHVIDLVAGACMDAPRLVMEGLGGAAPVAIQVQHVGSLPPLVAAVTVTGDVLVYSSRRMARHTLWLEQARGRSASSQVADGADDGLGTGFDSVERSAVPLFAGGVEDAEEAVQCVLKCDVRVRRCIAAVADMNDVRWEPFDSLAQLVAGATAGDRRDVDDGTGAAALPLKEFCMKAARWHPRFPTILATIGSDAVLRVWCVRLRRRPVVEHQLPFDGRAGGDECGASLTHFDLAWHPSRAGDLAVVCTGSNADPTASNSRFFVVSGLEHYLHEGDLQCFRSASSKCKHKKHVPDCVWGCCNLPFSRTSCTSPSTAGGESGDALGDTRAEYHVVHAVPGETIEPEAGESASPTHVAVRNAPVVTVAWQPVSDTRGHVVAGGHSDGLVRIWQQQTGRSGAQLLSELQPTEPGVGTVAAISFNPDAALSRLLAVGHEGVANNAHARVVCLWDRVAATHLATFHHGNDLPLGMPASQPEYPHVQPGFRLSWQPASPPANPVSCVLSSATPFRCVLWDVREDIAPFVAVATASTNSASTAATALSPRPHRSTAASKSEAATSELLRMLRSGEASALTDSFVDPLPDTRESGLLAIARMVRGLGSVETTPAMRSELLKHVRELLHDLESSGAHRAADSHSLLFLLFAEHFDGIGAASTAAGRGGRRAEVVESARDHSPMQPPGWPCGHWDETEVLLAAEFVCGGHHLNEADITVIDTAASRGLQSMLCLMLRTVNDLAVTLQDGTNDATKHLTVALVVAARTARVASIAALSQWQRKFEQLVERGAKVNGLSVPNSVSICASSETESAGGDSAVDLVPCSLPFIVFSDDIRRVADRTHRSVASAPGAAAIDGDDPPPAVSESERWVWHIQDANVASSLASLAGAAGLLEAEEAHLAHLLGTDSAVIASLEHSGSIGSTGSGDNGVTTAAPSSPGDSGGAEASSAEDSSYVGEPRVVVDAEASRRSQPRPQFEHGFPAATAYPTHFEVKASVLPLAGAPKKKFPFKVAAVVVPHDDPTPTSEDIFNARRAGSREPALCAAWWLARAGVPSQLVKLENHLAAEGADETGLEPATKYALFASVMCRTTPAAEGAAVEAGDGGGSADAEDDAGLSSLLDVAGNVVVRLDVSTRPVDSALLRASQSFIMKYVSELVVKDCDDAPEDELKRLIGEAGKNVRSLDLSGTSGDLTNVVAYAARTVGVSLTSLKLARCSVSRTLVEAVADEGNFPALRELSMQDARPEPDVAKAALSGGLDAVRASARDSQGPVTRLRMVKVVVLGAAGVGKTQLIDALEACNAHGGEPTGVPPGKPHDKRVSIDLRHLKYPPDHLLEPETTLDARTRSSARAETRVAGLHASQLHMMVWDCSSPGGYDPTHTIVLSDFSLNVVVFRLDVPVVDALSGVLEHVHSVLAHSVGGKIMLVGTHADKKNVDNLTRVTDAVNTVLMEYFVHVNKLCTAGSHGTVGKSEYEARRQAALGFLHVQRRSFSVDALSGQGVGTVWEAMVKTASDATVFPLGALVPVHYARLAVEMTALQRRVRRLMKPTHNGVELAMGAGGPLSPAGSTAGDDERQRRRDAARFLKRSLVCRFSDFYEMWREFDPRKLDDVAVMEGVLSPQGRSASVVSDPRGRSRTMPDAPGGGDGARSRSVSVAAVIAAAAASTPGSPRERGSFVSFRGDAAQTSSAQREDSSEVTVPLAVALSRQESDTDAPQRPPSHRCNEYARRGWCLHDTSASVGAGTFDDDELVFSFASKDSLRPAVLHLADVGCVLFGDPHGSASCGDDSNADDVVVIGDPQHAVDVVCAVTNHDYTGEASRARFCQQRGCKHEGLRRRDSFMKHGPLGFWANYRKGNCQRCLKLFCADHLTKQAFVPRLNKKASICNHCFDILGDRQAVIADASRLDGLEPASVREEAYWLLNDKGSAFVDEVNALTTGPTAGCVSRAFLSVGMWLDVPATEHVGLLRTMSARHLVVPGVARVREVGGPSGSAVVGGAGSAPARRRMGRRLTAGSRDAATKRYLIPNVVPMSPASQPLGLMSVGTTPEMPGAAADADESRSPPSAREAPTSLGLLHPSRSMGYTFPFLPHGFFESLVAAWFTSLWDFPARLELRYRDLMVLDRRSSDTDARIVERVRVRVCRDAVAHDGLHGGSTRALIAKAMPRQAIEVVCWDPTGHDTASSQPVWPMFTTVCRDIAEACIDFGGGSVVSQRVLAMACPHADCGGVVRHELPANVDDDGQVADVVARCSRGSACPRRSSPVPLKDIFPQLLVVAPAHADATPVATDDRPTQAISAGEQAIMGTLDALRADFAHKMSLMGGEISLLKRELAAARRQSKRDRGAAGTTMAATVKHVEEAIMPVLRDMVEDLHAHIASSMVTEEQMETLLDEKVVPLLSPLAPLLQNSRDAVLDEIRQSRVWLAALGQDYDTPRLAVLLPWVGELKGAGLLEKMKDRWGWTDHYTLSFMCEGVSHASLGGGFCPCGAAPCQPCRAPQTCPCGMSTNDACRDASVAGALAHHRLLRPTPFRVDVPGERQRRTTKVLRDWSPYLSAGAKALQFVAGVVGLKVDLAGGVDAVRDAAQPVLEQLPEELIGSFPGLAEVARLPRQHFSSAVRTLKSMAAEAANDPTAAAGAGGDVEEDADDDASDDDDDDDADNIDGDGNEESKGDEDEPGDADEAKDGERERASGVDVATLARRIEKTVAKGASYEALKRLLNGRTVDYLYRICDSQAGENGRAKLWVCAACHAHALSKHEAADDATEAGPRKRPHRYHVTIDDRVPDKDAFHAAKLAAAAASGMPAEFAVEAAKQRRHAVRRGWETKHVRLHGGVLTYCKVPDISAPEKHVSKELKDFEILRKTGQDDRTVLLHPRRGVSDQRELTFRCKEARVVPAFEAALQEHAAYSEKQANSA